MNQLEARINIAITENEIRELSALFEEALQDPRWKSLGRFAEVVWLTKSLIDEDYEEDFPIYYEKDSSICDEEDLPI